MYDKVITSIWELNTVARHLRNMGEIKKIELLAAKWQVPKKDMNEFIDGKRYSLADARIEEKDFESAGSKLREEMWLLNDKLFTDTIASVLIKNCENSKELADRVLVRHKTLQKCLDYIMKQAYQMAEEERKGLNGENELNTAKVRTDNLQPFGMAVCGDKVIAWAEKYYFLDDKEEEEKKKSEETEKRIKDLEKATGSTKKAVTSKAVGKPVAKKKEENQQMDLFTLMGEGN